jgi:hypothetical protein
MPGAAPRAPTLLTSDLRSWRWQGLWYSRTASGRSPPSSPRCDPPQLGWPGRAGPRALRGPRMHYASPDSRAAFGKQMCGVPAAALALRGPVPVFELRRRPSHHSPTAHSRPPDSCKPGLAGTFRPRPGVAQVSGADDRFQEQMRAVTEYLQFREVPQEVRRHCAPPRRPPPPRRRGVGQGAGGPARPRERHWTRAMARLLIGA